ncbi:MAG: alpha/beta fold hydrolase [Woeseia sp.]
MSISFPAPDLVDTNGIRMAAHQQGRGPPVILLHGFPELAFSWRHQLPALAAAGYRAIAPDQRGYGATDKPGGVADYTIQKLISDITGLLDALELERAVFVGHDWGALVLWQMALLAPERMAGLVNLTIPFFARRPTDPISLMRDFLGDDFYIVNFQDSNEADLKCDADPGRVFDVLMRTGQEPRGRLETLPKDRRVFSLLKALARKELRGEPLLNQEEHRVFTEAFKAGGFRGPINWYRNWSHNWSSTEGVEQTVNVPTLFIGAQDDILVLPAHIEAMKPHVPDLEIHMIGDCGHWTQQEKPEAVNELILAWLARRYPV